MFWYMRAVKCCVMFTLERNSDGVELGLCSRWWDILCHVSNLYGKIFFRVTAEINMKPPVSWRGPCDHLLHGPKTNHLEIRWWIFSKVASWDHFFSRIGIYKIYLSEPTHYTSFGLPQRSGDLHSIISALVQSGPCLPSPVIRYSMIRIY